MQIAAQYANIVVDLFAQAQQAVSDLVLTDGRLFETTANNWLDDFGAVAIFVLIVRSFLRGRSVPWLLEYGFGYLTAKTLLLFYSTPTFLLGGSSVSHFFINAFQGLSNQVDLATVQNAINAIDSVVHGSEFPSIFSPMKIVTYVGLIVDCSVLEIIIWVVTLAGLIGTGIGVVIGPLFIPWFVFPMARFITLRWISFMMMTAAYKLVGSIYVYIFAHVVITWTSYMVNGKLASLLMMTVPTTVIAFAMLVFVFFMFHWTHDLFSGTVSAALSGAGATMTALRIFV
jgi:hypothetical protein